MTPTREIIEAALRLPIEACRALAEKVGAGWWVEKDGKLRNIFPSPMFAWDVSVALAEGMVWLPANDTDWMEAANYPGGAVGWNGRMWWIDERSGTWRSHTDRSAPVCALKRWGVL